MKIKVVCSNCSNVIEWGIGNPIGRCEHCSKILELSRLRMAAGASRIFLPST